VRWLIFGRDLSTGQRVSRCQLWRSEWIVGAEVGKETQIIQSTVTTPLATKLNSQTTDVHSLPATTATLPASLGALEIAARPSVPTLASWTEHGGLEIGLSASLDPLWLCYIHI
jgi:hypothetical protein